MIDQLTFGAKWWAWWSNPLIGLHPDHEFYYTITADMKRKLSYLDLLQLRSKMGLNDLPDELLTEWPDLRVLALAEDTWFSGHLEVLSVLTLERSILQARAQDWEKLYGVQTQEKIRSIIIQHHEIPRPMLQWQDGLSRTLSQIHPEPLQLPARAELALTVLLKSFFPSFAKRWSLMLSHQTNKTVATLDEIDPLHWPAVKAWLGGVFSPLVEMVNQQFHVPFFDESNFNDDFDFESLEDLQTANAQDGGENAVC